jgi:hypothetical protein
MNMMKNKWLLPAIVMILITACNKDKFKTEPQVKIKSIAPSEVVSGDIILVKGEYTDDEGDVDSAFVVYKWYNGPTAGRNDTFRYDFNRLILPPKTREGDVELTFEYSTRNHPEVPGIGGVPRDTTAAFGLIFIDKAKHRSVYSESDKIRLKKP